MPNVPIVTEVTKAELEALVAANGLNEGLQYRVIDTNIDWLLVATSTNTLKAATGSLLMLNGTVLPSEISTDILLIDTGVVTGNYTTEPNNLLPITVPENYNFESVIVAPGVSVVFSIMDSEGNEVTGQANLSAGDLVGLKYIPIDNKYGYSLPVTSLFASGNESPGLRAILRFVKTYWV